MLDQKAREMSAADKIGVGDMRQSAGQAAVDSGFLQFIGNALRALTAAFTRACQSFGKLRMIGIDAQADDVQRLPIPRDRDFDPIDQVDSMFSGTVAGFRQPAGYIVVGKRQNADAALGRPGYQVPGIEQSVGAGGMAVEIYINNNYLFNQIDMNYY